MRTILAAVQRLILLHALRSRESLPDLSILQLQCSWKLSSKLQLAEYAEMSGNAFLCAWRRKGSCQR